VFAEDLIVLNVFPTNFVALQRIESSVCLAPNHFVWGTTLGARAGAVTRTRPELFTVSTPFFKAAGGELASRLWDLPAGLMASRPHFALLARLLAGWLGCG
jgi:hypothetical protein